MPVLLIDDSGEVWPAQPETLTRRFGLQHPHDLHLMLWAVALGFLFVTFGERGASLAFRPHLVTRTAEDRLFGIIRQRQPPRVAIAQDAPLSSWEIVIGAVHAIARIGRLVAEAQSPSPRPLLTSQRLRLNCRLDVAQRRLVPALRMWKEMEGRWEPESHDRLTQMGLLEEATLTWQQAGSERLLVDHLGIRNSLFGRNWALIAPGRDVEEAPNREIGLWRAAMVRQTIMSGEARLSADDLVLSPPEGGLVRRQSIRLALPWRTRDNKALLSAIHVDRHVFVLERPHPVDSPRAPADV